jgi:hypothetical protein
MWLDFRDTNEQESAYLQLLRHIPKAPVFAVPPLGANPFGGRSEVEVAFRPPIVCAFRWVSRRITLHATAVIYEPAVGYGHLEVRDSP